MINSPNRQNQLRNPLEINYNHLVTPERTTQVKLFFAIYISTNRFAYTVDPSATQFIDPPV
jgi:hypothetical protein